MRGAQGAQQGRGVAVGLDQFLELDGQRLGAGEPVVLHEDEEDGVAHRLAVVFEAEPEAVGDPSEIRGLDLEAARKRQERFSEQGAVLRRQCDAADARRCLGFIETISPMSIRASAGSVIGNRGIYATMSRNQVLAQCMESVKVIQGYTPPHGTQSVQ